jgi:hypothetical protein
VREGGSLVGFKFEVGFFDDEQTALVQKTPSQWRGVD